jgi:hypothetical protein
MKKIIILAILIFWILNINSVNAGAPYNWKWLLEYWKCNDIAKKHFKLEKENQFWSYNCYYFKDEKSFYKIFMIDYDNLDNLTKFWIRTTYSFWENNSEKLSKFRNKVVSIDSWITALFVLPEVKRTFLLNYKQISNLLI